MRYRILLAYDGSGFTGWQVQPEKRTVQGELARAFSRLGEDALPTGAGRTDAGVHALGLVAHVDLRREWDPGELEAGLASLVPPEISITRVTPAAESFHARYDAVSRTYHYAVGERPDPFYRLRRWNPGIVPESDWVRPELAGMPGTRDFSSLAKSGGSATSARSRVTAAEWRSYPGGAILAITADRFLYGMVRALVGTLVRGFQVGERPGHLERVLARGARAAAGEAAPASGLYLAGVRYADEDPEVDCMDAVAELSGINSFASPGETAREGEATRNHA
jgi:tRNA pseudouridine38-40 synthase